MKKEPVRVKNEKNTDPMSAPMPKESKEDQERALKVARLIEMAEKGGLCF